MRYTSMPILLAMLAGCGEPMISDGSSDAIVRGVITSPSGPVAGARVTFTASDSSTAMVRSGGSVTTDATGHYSLHLVAFLIAPFRGAVAVAVASPTPATLRDSTVVVFVSFRQPPGLVTADVALQPVP